MYIEESVSGSINNIYFTSYYLFTFLKDFLHDFSYRLTTLTLKNGKHIYTYSNYGYTLTGVTTRREADVAINKRIFALCGSMINHH